MLFRPKRRKVVHLFVEVGPSSGVSHQKINLLVTTSSEDDETFQLLPGQRLRNFSVRLYDLVWSIALPSGAVHCRRFYGSWRKCRWRSPKLFCTRRGVIVPCDTLAQAHLPTLAWRRQEHILSLVWMLCNKQGPPQLLKMLPEPSHTRSICSLRSRHSLQFPLLNSECHLSAFFCTVIPQWNALPSSVALCSSLASFCASLQKFFSKDMFSYGL